MCILVRYYFDQRLKEAFTTAPADPTVDLNMQLWVTWICSFTSLAFSLLIYQLVIPLVMLSAAAKILCLTKHGMFDTE